jgi:hypothetical protein
MDILTATITSHRAIDGLIAAANKNGESLEAFVNGIITDEGLKYARLNGVGVITSAAFISRFTQQEFGDILAAAKTNEAVQGLVTTLLSVPFVDFDDPRLLPGLQLLAGVGLIQFSRIAELMTYDRPEPASP